MTESRILPARLDGVSASLPPDLLEQVRGRVRLLAGFFMFAFGFDLLVFLVTFAVARLSGRSMPVEAAQTIQFNWVNLGAVGVSFALWWLAGSGRIPAPRLHALALGYEIVMCFIVGIVSYWPFYIARHELPNLTWVPAIVIMFPLIMPGPPRRMLITALTAGAMAPFALLLLDLTGKVQVEDGGKYFEQIYGGLAASGFAYFGARVIYGLGREVAEARDLGAYHLGELLGRGGMGEVYRATHRLLARPSAIKLIRVELMGGPNSETARLATQRFRREATAAASLRSPHTVELYDFGVTEDQTLYFVMELLEGMDLERLVRRKGPLPANRVIHIVIQVCESLEEAHRAGLVHRDIKPANIHLGRLGLTWDFVKVLDFGLVKSLAAPVDEHSHATAAGHVPGTPAYLAPELALGEPIDGRADLYALGGVAYFLLTGCLVFEGDNGVQLIAKHVRDAPVPPSQRTECHVPPELERLVLACLAKSPDDRPATAAALASALAQVQVAPWDQAQAERWWRLNGER